MICKKLFLLVIGSVFVLTSAGKSISDAKIVEKLKANVVSTVRRTVNSELPNTEDADVIFERAISDYQNVFSDYINIAGINVIDMEAIDLPSFDFDYNAPDFDSVMYDYQTNLENTLTTEQLSAYEELRMQDYNFDRYVSLNNIKYKNLQPQLKYSHRIVPVHKLHPITPLHPNVDSGEQTMRLALAPTAGIVTILSNVGLSEAIISAFTACVSTMTTGLSTSWIPFVGWVLAVALVVGALIALTVIIVQNWDEIKSVIDDIKNWFLEQFGRFASLITSFFSDAITKGHESTISSTTVVDGKTFEFTEVKASDLTATIAIAVKCRRNKDVLLIKKVGKVAMQIALTTPVTMDFCIQNKTHLNGFSSYTWYQNNARNLIIKAGSEYSNDIPEYHLKSIDRPNAPEFAFKHYHNYNSLGSRIYSPNIIYKVHSFFGLVYYSPNNDGQGLIHPNGPQN